MLKIAAIQFDIIWEDAKANRTYLEPHIRAHADADVVILPEMFNAGFTINVDVAAEENEGATVQWMQNLAEELDCAICGSIPTKLPNQYVNRFYWVEANRILHYDKRHLFGYGKETDVYSGGNKHLLVEYKGWKIMPLICYDLRFPVWSRNTVNYDLLLYVANWPDARASAWRQLIRARAIENLCYVCGLNRIGVDGVGLNYIGDSAIIDFLGHDIASAEDKEEIITASLEKNKMHSFREQFNFLNDRDAFTLV